MPIELKPHPLIGRAVRHDNFAGDSAAVGKIVSLRDGYDIKVKLHVETMGKWDVNVPIEDTYEYHVAYHDKDLNLISDRELLDDAIDSQDSGDKDSIAIIAMCADLAKELHDHGVLSPADEMGDVTYDGIPVLIDTTLNDGYTLIWHSEVIADVMADSVDAPIEGVTH